MPKTNSRRHALPRIQSPSDERKAYRPEGKPIDLTQVKPPQRPSVVVQQPASQVPAGAPRDGSEPAAKKAPEA